MLPRNFTLRVPQGACVPLAGIICYEVLTDTETLESIAHSVHSVYRSVEKLLYHNKHTMWGQRKLFKGMQLRLPNPPCIPEHGNPQAPLICHTVQAGEDLASIVAFYETDHATVQELNTERLGPHNSTTATGMQLQIPHPHPTPDHSRPCVPDKWGGFWSCYEVPDPVDVGSGDDDQPIKKGQDIYEIAQITSSDPWKICELNPWVNCTPAFACTNGSSPFINGTSPCSVLILPTSATGKPLHVASTECTPPADNSYSCARVPIDLLPYNDTNLPWVESLDCPIAREMGHEGMYYNGIARIDAFNLSTRGPSSYAFNYADGTGPEVAVEWYQAYMNYNAPFLARRQTFGWGRAPDDDGQPPDIPWAWECLRRNDDNTSLTSIQLCAWYAGMHIKVPNQFACTSADPNACFTITEDDTRCVSQSVRRRKIYDSL
jgi:hypothetical protein